MLDCGSHLCRSLRAAVLAHVGLFALACTDGGRHDDGDPISRGDTDGADEGSSSPEKLSRGPCDAYIACVAEVAPEALPTAIEGYGDEGSCWGPRTDELCLEACVNALERLRESFGRASSCADGSSPVPAADTDEIQPVPSVDYETDIQPIWNEHCAPLCHEPGGTWSPVELVEGTSYDVLLSQSSTQSALPFVAPGDPRRSYLWHKLNGTQAETPAKGSGERMPNGIDANSLGADELALIEAWIKAGARP